MPYYERDVDLDFIFDSGRSKEIEHVDYKNFPALISKVCDAADTIGDSVNSVIITF